MAFSACESTYSGQDAICARPRRIRRSWDTTWCWKDPCCNLRKGDYSPRSRLLVHLITKTPHGRATSINYLQKHSKICISSIKHLQFSCIVGASIIWHSHPSGPHRGADWFKSTPKDIKAEPVATSTLAEMLRRDPPNVSNPHTPPVYYGIGPRNKGYEILSKIGWEEGQPLGPRAGLGSVRSSRRGYSPKQGASRASEPTETKEKKEKWMVLDSAMPKLLLPCGEGSSGEVDVIDLTVSNEEESDDSSEEEEEEDTEIFSKPNGEREGDGSSSGTESEEGYHQQPTLFGNRSKAILTPIPVALKHDRKGLGLSKSKKLVTHSSLALLHHIQHGALDRRQHISEMRRMERERLRGDFGRGKNAFARKVKEEQRKRDRLMEYMGS